MFGLLHLLMFKLFFVNKQLLCVGGKIQEIMYLLCAMLNRSNCPKVLRPAI